MSNAKNRPSNLRFHTTAMSSEKREVFYGKNKIIRTNSIEVQSMRPKEFENQPKKEKITNLSPSVYCTSYTRQLF